jgi:hypothetical protein
VETNINFPQPDIVDEIRTRNESQMYTLQQASSLAQHSRATLPNVSKTPVMDMGNRSELSGEADNRDWTKEEVDVDENPTLTPTSKLLHTATGPRSEIITDQSPNFENAVSLESEETNEHVMQSQIKARAYGFDFSPEIFAKRI